MPKTWANHVLGIVEFDTTNLNFTFQKTELRFLNITVDHKSQHLRKYCLYLCTSILLEIHSTVASGVKWLSVLKWVYFTSL